MRTVLGLLELVFYVVTILALSAGVTFLVVKVSPLKPAKRQTDKT